MCLAVTCSVSVAAPVANAPCLASSLFRSITDLPQVMNATAMMRDLSSSCLKMCFHLTKHFLLRQALTASPRISALLQNLSRHSNLCTRCLHLSLQLALPALILHKFSWRFALQMYESANAFVCFSIWLMKTNQRSRHVTDFTVFHVCDSVCLAFIATAPVRSGLPYPVQASSPEIVLRRRSWNTSSSPSLSQNSYGTICASKPCD